MINKFSKVFAIIFTLFISSNALSQKLDKSFGDWNVLSTQVKSQKVCYIASLPITQNGSVKKATNAYFLVSLFPERSPEVSYSPGFDIKVDSQVKIDIDGYETLITKVSEQVVWASNADEDSEIILELKKGIKLKVLAPDNNGNYSLDIFSLKGFTAAYNHMLKLCERK
ncbi:MAG: invasion associated locus B family protein [Rickettsiales bacterium]|nr:invasion associated locus B family protein [Rickettsiales bacterium]